ncbi:hypothetical protein HYX06_03525 [Candidatus Woesearchaeota archaeon]|nr:hypothetical protein [Candidatus Woesearchaeota archaeon]
MPEELRISEKDVGKFVFLGDDTLTIVKSSSHGVFAAKALEGVIAIAFWENGHGDPIHKLEEVDGMIRCTRQSSSWAYLYPGDPDYQTIRNQL